MVDEADVRGPGRSDVLARVGELGHVALSDDVGKALQAAQVGDDRHLGLPDREDRVGTGQTDVAGRSEVDPAPQAVPLDGGDDRHRAVGHRRDRSLHAEHVGPHRRGADRG